MVKISRTLVTGVIMVIGCRIAMIQVQIDHFMIEPKHPKLVILKLHAVKLTVHLVRHHTSSTDKTPSTMAAGLVYNVSH